MYAMRVTETLGFDDYWSDPRFLSKRPHFDGSRKQAYGDNIYHHGTAGDWSQEDSHHSLPGGRINPKNLIPDTSCPRVLISKDYCYWGKLAPEIPLDLRNRQTDQDICHDRPGHRSNFTTSLIEDFEKWFRSFGSRGVVGLPRDW